MLTQTITLCGSVSRHKSLLAEYRNKLEALGHSVLFFPTCFELPVPDKMYKVAVKPDGTPKDIAFIDFNNDKPTTVSGLELEMLLIRSHWEKIKLSDAILVINEGCYIGGNTMMDVAIALEYDKRVYTTIPVLSSCENPNCKTLDYWSSVFVWG